MRNNEIKNIWQTPKYLPYVQPNLTDEILAEAEKKIGFKLPKELIEILKIQNGGYIRYKLLETTHELIHGIGPYFPSLMDFDWEESKEYVSFKLDGLVPIDGDGHWYICLDYRSNQKKPKISFIDIECDEQEIIANSFSEYLDLLELDTEIELVIDTENSIEEILNEFEGIFQIKFVDPDNFDFGYSIYKSKYKDIWIWLTPNKVPDGFVRENDQRYSELKEQISFSGVRFPEINDKMIFLELSNMKLKDEIIHKLSERGIKIKLFAELIKQSEKLTDLSVLNLKQQKIKNEKSLSDYFVSLAFKFWSFLKK
jgi:hypothetical protein